MDESSNCPSVASVLRQDQCLFFAVPLQLVSSIGNSVLHLGGGVAVFSQTVAVARLG